MGGFRFPFFPRFSPCRQGRPSCGSTAATAQTRKAKAFKFVFAALLQALAFAASYTAEPAAFSEADLMGIAVWASAVNAVLLLGPLLLLRSALMANIVLSLVVLGGVFTAHIAHTELYFPENRAALIAACAAAGFALFTAFRVIDERRRGGAALAAAALTGIGVVVVGYFLSGINKNPGDVDMTTNIRDISFKETPNLYFISFDGMTPKPLLRKHLGLESTEFHDVFEENFRRFPNFFANAAPTRNSYDMTLSLDEDIFFEYRDTKPYGRGTGMFSGHYPSPLFRILRRNGYEISSFFVNLFFGSLKGPYIDNYFTVKKNNICNLLTKDTQFFSFWGYCEFPSRKYGLDYWRKYMHSDRVLIEKIESLAANDGPQFALAHILRPYHAGELFRYEDASALEEFKAHYRRSCNEAVRYLEQIIEHLKNNDPDAILFVFGDHGPFLSRGLKSAGDMEFFIQDTFGVLGGVYPRDRCASCFDETLSQGYMTILGAVHAMLRCLSGGESALIEPRKHTLRGPRGQYGILVPNPIPPAAQLDYKEFLYE